MQCRMVWTGDFIRHVSGSRFFFIQSFHVRLETHCNKVKPGFGYWFGSVFKVFIIIICIDWLFNWLISQLNNFFCRMNVARLHIFLKDKTSLRYKTDVRYDVEDFVSNIGGLLGLGVGICFISVVEIFYFLCIRGFLKIAVKRYKSRNGHRPIPSNWKYKTA